MLFKISTSKMMLAFGGITAPAPLSPYPKLEGIKKIALSLKFILLIPSKKPAIKPSFFHIGKGKVGNRFGWLCFDQIFRRFY